MLEVIGDSNLESTDRAELGSCNAAGTKHVLARTATSTPLYSSALGYEGKIRDTRLETPNSLL